jgi:hypothetical protein
VTELSVTEQGGEHGFPASARILVGTGGTGSDVAGVDAVDLAVTPLAFGPTLFTNDDGRISRFPRALVHVAAADGRLGTGWIEWNQPEPAAP